MTDKHRLREDLKYVDHAAFVLGLALRRIATRPTGDHEFDEEVKRYLETSKALMIHWQCLLGEEAGLIKIDLMEES